MQSNSLRHIGIYTHRNTLTAVASPTMWNSLPKCMRSTETSAALRKQVFTNTVSDLYRLGGGGGLTYSLVLLVLVVNREQTIIVQLLKVSLPLVMFILLKLCLVHPCLEKHKLYF